MRVREMETGIVATVQSVHAEASQPMPPRFLAVGPSVRLRLVTMRDVTPTYLGWLNDPVVTRHLRTKRITLGVLRRWVADKMADPLVTFLAICRKDRRIGHIKIEFAGDFGSAWVGLMIGNKAEWGKGYGTEAILLACDVARWRNVPVMYASIRSGNRASVRAFEKAGFRLKRHRRDWWATKRL